MLDPRQYIKETLIEYAQPLESFLKRPFPRTAEGFWEMEKELSQTADEIADRILIVKIVEAHNDRSFVVQAVEQGHQASDVRLVNKGWKETRVLLPGGTRLVIKTPYLREDHQGKRGKKRRVRRKEGKGIYPVLEALGIRDGVSPATRSDMALYTVQAGSYVEAQKMLEQRGILCDISSLKRVALATARDDIALCAEAIQTARAIPVPVDGPLSGKRVRVSLDGGRVRTRKRHKGRKTRKGRHGFSTPWREPRVLVIDILEDEGKTDPLRLPLYDALIGHADVIFWLVVGYLRMLGAAYAKQILFIADGADWIWDRIDDLMLEAAIPCSIWVEAIDFYHASEHLAKTVEWCRNLSEKERQRLYQKLRHILRHEQNGVDEVIEQLKPFVKGRRGKKMKRALAYFEKHSKRMLYPNLDQMKLPVGSGQVESAVRRIINLRFKAPGSFWCEEDVSDLMHLRAYFKAGRWDELIRRVLRREFLLPSFEPIQKRPPTEIVSEKEAEMPLQSDYQEAA